MSSWSLHVPTFVVAVAMLLVIDLHPADAKRSEKSRLVLRARSAAGGCTTFGHSCYGGMGKRGLTDEVPLEIEQNEEDPALVFTGPRSEYRPRHEQIRLSPQQLYNLSPFIRQWLKTLSQMEEDERLSNEN